MEDSLGYCFSLTLEPLPEPVCSTPRLLTLAEPVETSTASALQLQYVRAALTAWRSKNAWAHGIQFEDFPEKYKDTIKLAAYINQNKEAL